MAPQKKFGICITKNTQERKICISKIVSLNLCLKHNSLFKYTSKKYNSGQIEVMKFRNQDGRQKKRFTLQEVHRETKFVSHKLYF